jgi:hypothetical protein
MSVEREFPMPKQLGQNALGVNNLSEFAKRLGEQTNQQVNDYVPQRHRTEGDADKEAPVSERDPARKVKNIKGWLRLLTYREMREFVEEIFNEHKELFGENEGNPHLITATQLADVFDKIAYGD